jgi:hypothetical protein
MRYRLSAMQMRPSRANLLQVTTIIVLVVVWITQRDFICKSKLALE